MSRRMLRINLQKRYLKKNAFYTLRLHRWALRKFTARVTQVLISLLHSCTVGVYKYIYNALLKTQFFYVWLTITVTYVLIVLLLLKIIWDTSDTCGGKKNSTGISK